MISANFLQMIRFKKPKLEKEINFYNPKDKNKKLWFWSSFFHLNVLIQLYYLLKKLKGNKKNRFDVYKIV